MTRWLFVIAIAACGKSSATDPDTRLPDGNPPGSCTALQGIYHADLHFEGYESATSFRIDQTGSTYQLATGLGTVPLTVGATLTATIGDTASSRTLAVDQLDADCTMHGTWTSCRNGDCYAYTLFAKKTDRLAEPVAHGMTLLSEFVGNPGDEWWNAGLAVNVRVANGLAYMANYEDGLRIVDVHDPAHPVELGHQKPMFPTDGEIYNDVKIVGASGKTYALMASNFRGVDVVDVTDPHAPSIVTSFGTAAPQQTSINVHTIFVDGGKAYLANIDVGLEIWDLADPAHPVKLGQWAHDATPPAQPFPHDLYVSGARAYVNYWDAGMSIVDVSTPAAPKLVGEFTGYGQHTSHSSWVTKIGDRMIAVHGDEQWNSHLHLVDVTEGTPAFGTSIAEWGTREEVSAHNIMAFGSRAYVAYYQDGVRVLDLSDPAHPQPIAWFDTWPGYDQDYGTSFYEGAIGIDVDLDAKLVYVADSHRGLIVLHLDV
ncbi:MAG TPA: hypothetical protein VL463_14765 [Kofleriaceae bacterium]|nr:hypothetical protein [Kofleriaceae bacterium]